MKTITKIVVLTLLAIVSSLNAQDFQGVATYKTHRAVDIKLDSTQVNSEMQKQMMEMMKKQFQKTFKLTFSKEASLYKEEESLDKPQVGGGFQVVVMGSGGSDVLYKNTKSNSFINQTDTFGKLFLVKDSIQKLDWKLGSETKYIGEYQCFKATYTKMVPKPRKIDDIDDFDEDAEPEKEERTVTAWYTIQIPVNLGPDNYQGLPGLILEVHDGKFSIVCSKIVLNPQDKIEIKEPSKGKAVNQKEFDAIMKKKSKEMMERYRPRKGSKDGESFSITIGG